MSSFSYERKYGATPPNHALRTWDVQASADPLHDVADAAVDLTWIRDPFDRLIVANAMLHDAPLVTRDRRIHAQYPKAFW